MSGDPIDFVDTERILTRIAALTTATEAAHRRYGRRHRPNTEALQASVDALGEERA